MKRRFAVEFDLVSALVKPMGSLCVAFAIAIDRDGPASGGEWPVVSIVIDHIKATSQS